MSVYRRRLRQSEAERYFIYIEKAVREMFPKPRNRFDVIVKGNPFDVEIDDNWRIWANYFWDILPSFKEGDIIIIEKNGDDSFTITIEPLSNPRKPT